MIANPEYRKDELESTSLLPHHSNGSMDGQAVNTQWTSDNPTSKAKKRHECGSNKNAHLKSRINCDDIMAGVISDPPSKGDTESLQQSTNGPNSGPSIRTSHSKSDEALVIVEQNPLKPRPLFETYYGFVEDSMDALHVVEGVVRGYLHPFIGTAIDMSRVEPRSGTVIVVSESSSSIKRWRDNIKWSSSRAYGRFILYRQIENADPKPKEANPTANPKVLEDIVLRQSARIPGLEPQFSKTLRPGTQIVENGLTKRTISLVGSNGLKYRVVSYYCPEDVLNMTCRLSSNGEDCPQPASNATPFQRASEDAALTALASDGTVDYHALLAGDVESSDRTLKRERPSFSKRVKREYSEDRDSGSISLESSSRRRRSISKRVTRECIEDSDSGSIRLDQSLVHSKKEQEIDPCPTETNVPSKVQTSAVSKRQREQSYPQEVNQGLELTKADIHIGATTDQHTLCPQLSPLPPTPYTLPPFGQPAYYSNLAIHPSLPHAHHHGSFVPHHSPQHWYPYQLPVYYPTQPMYFHGPTGYYPPHHRHTQINTISLVDKNILNKSISLYV
ncbi:Gti1/Pac2 family-domain-containing protein [Obelidium mucronatum]|nr:Gti1/Pac2 family-domain-containing protein [Obelidium mucronatum]